MNTMTMERRKEIGVFLRSGRELLSTTAIETANELDRVEDLDRRLSMSNALVLALKEIAKGAMFARKNHHYRDRAAICRIAKKALDAYKKGEC